MPIIKLIYADGSEQLKEASVNVRRLHGVKLNNRRPIKALVPSGFTDDFLRNLDIMLDPRAPKPRVITESTEIM